MEQFPLVMGVKPQSPLLAPECLMEREGFHLDVVGRRLQIKINLRLQIDGNSRVLSSSATENTLLILANPTDFSYSRCMQ